MSIEVRFKEIKAHLKDSSLVAVTKNVTEEEIKQLYHFGQRDFGENRVQDLLRKQRELPEDINWHFIGHLQRNKIKKILGLKNLKYIHSIDSLKLVQELIKQKSYFVGEKLNLFLEFNVSGEVEKDGFESYEALREAALRLMALSPKMEFIGLMAIGRIRGGDFMVDARESFIKLRKIKDRLQEELQIKLKLSMGMSQDYLIAIEEGSNFVRIGRALFQ